MTVWGTMVICGALAAGSCKRKSDAERGPTSAADQPGTAAYALEEGETLWRTDGTNVQRVVVRTRQGQEVRLYPVRTGDNRGALRAQRGDVHKDVESFSLRAGGRPDFTLRELPNGRLLFEYGPVAADEARGRKSGTDRAVLLLAWNEESGDVDVLKRWRGAASDRRPAWAKSGDASLSASALASCQAVARRIAACAGEVSFRDALFETAESTQRSRLERALQGDSRGWGSASGAQAQCRAWAGPGYEAGALSDPEELAELERDTALDCKMFGHELEDEGGLPRRTAVARAQPDDEAPVEQRAQGRTPTRR